MTLRISILAHAQPERLHGARCPAKNNLEPSFIGGNPWIDVLVADQACAHSSRAVRHVTGLAKLAVKLLALFDGFRLAAVRILAGAMEFAHRLGELLVGLWRHIERRIVEDMTEFDLLRQRRCRPEREQGRNNHRGGAASCKPDR